MVKGCALAGPSTQTVDHEHALALVGRAGDVPLLQGEALPARGDPDPIATSSEAGLLQQLLRATRVESVTHGDGTGDLIVVVRVGMSIEVAEQPFPIGDGLQQRLSVNQVHDRLTYPNVGR